ncbi:MAG: metallophosphoesterase family protein [Pirellulaceae bacterium]
MIQKKWFHLFVGCACVWVWANAVPIGRAHEGHDHPEPVAIEAAEQFAPSVLPDRIVLTWSADPARTQDVTWRTSTDVTRAFAEFAVAEGGPYFTKHTLRVDATTNEFPSDLGTAHYHRVHLAGLTSDTKYVYRVGDGVNWSEWFHFSTASDKPKPFSFIYFGDAQNDIRSHWSRVVREAHADAPRAAFMLHAGDLVNSPKYDAEWGQWFGAGGWINAMIPSIATPGNHEYRTETDQPAALTPYWKTVFSFPKNGPEGFDQTAYYLDYQGVRIISLNSNEKLAEQVQWLQTTLSQNKNRWTILTFHHPVFSSAKGRDNADLRATWKPVIDKYHVDIVLQGHDHSYARTGYSVPDNVGSGLNLHDGDTVYVVSVSGPKMYQVDQQDFMKRSASGVQLYQVIHVDHNELKYEARLATGELYDGFTLHKDQSGNNKLEEQVPATPVIDAHQAE